MWTKVVMLFMAKNLTCTERNDYQKPNTLSEQPTGN